MPASAAVSGVRDPEAGEQTEPEGQPRTIGGASWVLPPSVREAVRKMPDRRTYADIRCEAPAGEDGEACGSPLFIRLPVVRMARGYADGQSKGNLFQCVACGTIQNPNEIHEIGRVPEV